MSLTLDNSWVLIAAAGSGSRMQSETPKQHMLLAGKPVLQHVLERFLGWSSSLQIALVARADTQTQPGITAINDPRVYLVEGGATRAESVLNGLHLIASESPADTAVLVHDAARPLVRKSDVVRLLERSSAARRDGRAVGGILATPVTDTVKLAESAEQDPSGCSLIEHTLDRNLLWHARTPQLFVLDELRQAMQHESGNAGVTDEASAMEHTGQQVLMVECSSDNIKITRAEDLQLAEALLALQTRAEGE